MDSDEEQRASDPEEFSPMLPNLKSPFKKVRRRTSKVQFEDQVSPARASIPRTNTQAAMLQNTKQTSILKRRSIPLRKQKSQGRFIGDQMTKLFKDDHLYETGLIDNPNFKL